MKHKMIVIAAAFAAWAILVICGLRSVPVRLAFYGEEPDGIGLEVSQSDGRTKS